MGVENMSVNKGGNRRKVVVVSRYDYYAHPLPQPPELMPETVALRPEAFTYITAVQGLVAVAAYTSVAPIERLHLLMQSQNELINSARLSTPFKGIKDCFLRTLNKDGFFSLWRGNSVNLLKAFTSQALVYAIMKNSWYKVADNDEYGDFKFHAAVASATLIQYPLDYTRTRLANDVKAAGTLQFSLDSAKRNLVGKDFGSRMYTGMLDVWKQTLKTEGVLGLYKGYSPSFLGILAWDWARYKLTMAQKRTKEQSSQVRDLPPITIYGIPIAIYPMTCVSRRMMMNSGEGAATIKYKNSIHAFREIVKHEGFFSLYKGATAGLTLSSARFLALHAWFELVYLIHHKFVE